MQTDPFRLKANGTIKITTGAVARTALPEGGQNIELSNADTAIIIFVEIGDQGCVATSSTSYPILPGQSKIVGRTNNAGFISTLAASGAPILYVSVGESA